MSWRALLPTPRHALWLIVASMALIAPAFIFGAGGFDLQTQSLWSREFAAQFYAGEFYPRWLMRLFAGAGSPAFFYNPPLPFWLMLPFYPLRHYDEFGYAMQAASCGIALLVSGFTMHAWLRDVGLPRSSAMVGSVLYLVAPHHLAQNFYTLLLYASVWAYVFVPLLFLFARRLALAQPGGTAGYAASLGLLLLTHTPNSMVFGILSMLYFLGCLPRPNLAMLVRTGCAITLGFALSACFLLPCLLYLKFVSLGMLQVGAPDMLKNADYSQFFFGYAHKSAYSFECYWFVSALLTAALVRPAMRLVQGRLMIAFGIGALFLMLPVSAWLWTHVPLVKFIQLAARLFFVMTVVHVYLLAHLWPHWRAPIVALLALSTAVTLATAMHGREPTYAAFAEAHPMRIEGLRMRIEQYPNMLPNAYLLMRYGSPEGRAAIRADNPRLRIIEGEGDARITRWKPRHIAVQASMGTDGLLRVRQLWFYGIAATVDGRAVEPLRDEQTGFILVPVPAGNHAVTVTLEKLIFEKLGALISFVALCIWSLLVLVAQVRRRA